MGCTIAALLISCFGAFCASLPQGQHLDEKGPLQPTMNKMAIFNEDPCLRKGGQCVLRDHCPEGKLAEIEGLCPDQQRNDVECCYTAARTARDSTRCEALGGFCSKKAYCGHNIRIQAAEDCPSDEDCCALVR